MVALMYWSLSCKVISVAVTATILLTLLQPLHGIHMQEPLHVMYFFGLRLATAPESKGSSVLDEGIP